jgi:hypothetical protein
LLQCSPSRLMHCWSVVSSAMKRTRKQGKKLRRSRRRR